MIVAAGCGAGDGLCELHREYPDGCIEGLEWSWPLRFVCAWRRRFARVRRAAAKAAPELRRGAWLASLEFEARSLQPRQVLKCADGRSVWLYQAPFKAPASGTTEIS